MAGCSAGSWTRSATTGRSASRCRRGRHDYERQLSAPAVLMASPSPAKEAPMNKNRSMPDATVIPVLVYPDVRAAVAWLTEAFGFAERVRIGEDHRSQMRIGTDGGVIVADVRGEQQPPQAG